MSPPGDELLVPFRPRHSRRTFDDLFINVNERVNQFSRSCSRRTKKSLARISRSTNDTCSVVSKVTDDTEIEVPQPDEAAEPSKNHDKEVHEYHASVVSVVHDDDLFRRLQQEMRKSNRSGCGSSHAIHKFVERERAEERSRRELSLSMRDLQTPEEQVPVEKKPDDELEDRRLQLLKLQQSKSLPGRQLISGFTSGFGASIRSRFQTPPCA